MAALVNETLLDERLGALESARSWSPRVMSKLESHIRSADDAALFRINPLRFAGEKNISEAETIDLLLHATALGLFQMNWLLLCPLCSGVVQSLNALKNVHNHYHCFVCQTGFEAKLDEFICVTFTVSPTIRDIRFHHPEQLSPREYFFDFCGNADGCLPDGTPLSTALASLVKEISHLPPGTTTDMTIEADAGTIFGASREGRAGILASVEGAPAPAPQRFDVEFADNVQAYTHETVAPGHMTFALRNTSGERGTFMLAIMPPGFVPGQAPLAFQPFLTGKRLLTTQTFRLLFRSEVISANEGIGVKDIALLFTDLKGSTALYDRIGDLNAFALVQQHFECLQAVTARHNGAIIKTIGDAVMAAFLEPIDAVRAALAMRGEIASFNRERASRELMLKIGIHAGAAIAVTLNERLDYFGQTVNVASRVQQLADADDIVISDSVFEAAGVQSAIADFPAEREIVNLRGMQDSMPVFRIRSLPAHKAAPSAALNT